MEGEWKEKGEERRRQKKFQKRERGLKRGRELESPLPPPPLI
jgi:hypothetical protein